jgi:hypothetical protein
MNVPAGGGTLPRVVARRPTAAGRSGDLVLGQPVTSDEDADGHADDHADDHAGLPLSASAVSS